LRAALLHQHFPQNFIYGFGNSPLRSHLKSRISQTAVADPNKRRSLLPYFCRKYYCHQYFNCL